MRSIAGSLWPETDSRDAIIRHLYICALQKRCWKNFSYLGSEKAEEVVITNTNKIADMIEKISPIHPDKFPPVIENSDQDPERYLFLTVHMRCMVKIFQRLWRRPFEQGVAFHYSNGYAVMYIIAQKLVWKSNEDGYLVGSRGSVGSSLAATMSGITEVNPPATALFCPESEIQ